MRHQRPNTLQDLVWAIEHVSKQCFRHLEDSQILSPGRDGVDFFVYDILCDYTRAQGQ